MAAVLLVALVGVLVRAPLERVPENTIKFAVGLLLTSFGIFWGGEGAGVSWPGSDLAILGILAFLAVASAVLVRLLRRERISALPGGGRRMRHVRAFGAFWWDFIVGDDWVVAVGVAAGLGLSALLAHRDIAAWWVLPAAVVVVLVVSLRRATRNSS